jgi:hypothetical protein
METNWLTTDYLLKGTNEQIEVYYLLKELNIFEDLAKYKPVLVGTYPINLDIPGSDLDIICEIHDFDTFTTRVNNLYSNFDDFSLKEKIIKEVPSVVVNFKNKGYLFELFGQPIKVEQQHGYRHMVIEAKLLSIGGEELRSAIKQLKLFGIKTEPAFAEYFDISGDPYQAVLDLEGLSGPELIRFINSKGASKND